MTTEKLQKLIEEYLNAAGRIYRADRLTTYAIIHHSTAIEGSSLTSQQVINLLEFGKTSPGKLFEHHVMVHDHYKALLFIEQKAQEKSPVTPEFIRQIAAMVMSGTGGVVNTAAGTFNVAEGQYRLCSVRAGNRIFPDYKKVPGLIESLCHDITKAFSIVKTFEDKCNLAFMAHFRLVSIHPFGDGNGRTARLLMNYILLRFNLPPFSVLKQDRIRYIDALEKARNTDDITHFYRFMYAQYAKFLKQEIKNFSKH